MELCDLQSCVEALREDGAVEEYQVDCNNTLQSAVCIPLTSFLLYFMQYVKEIDVRHYNFTAALKCNESKNRYADVQASESKYQLSCTC